ncbi:MAG: hypothetical protein ACFFBD_27935 [Candidatus Hodarchaeota archaeon]
MVNLLEPTGLIGLLSFLMALGAGIFLLYTYMNTKKLQRLIWGIGMVAYASGHLIFAIAVLFEIRATDFEFFKFLIWFYINISGAITMGCMLAGVLPFFFEDNKVINWGLPVLYALGYFLGTTLFGYILPGNTPLNFINLEFMIMQTQYPTDSYFQYANMSWFAVEWLIPASFAIGFLFLQHYRQREAQPSLFIAIHFIGYALLLFIWPFTELKLIFYASRCAISALLLYGFWLMTKKD